MDTYVRGVIIMGAVSSLVIAATPAGFSARYVRYISSLLLLFVLLSPISGIFELAASLRTELPVAEGGESKAEQSVIAVSAENISRFIVDRCAEKFSLTPENVRVRLILDESDTESVRILEIQIFTDEKRKEEKERIKKYFVELLETEVFVFGP